MKTRMASRTCAALVVALASLGFVSSTPAGAATTPGYRLLGGDGGVFTFGGASFQGSAASDPAKCPTNPPARALPGGSCTSLASTPDGKGYWILNRALGTVYAFGSAGSFGQPADQFKGVSPEFVPTFVAIVSTPKGDGYWVLAQGASGAGRVFNFGAAKFFGDTQTIASKTQKGFNGGPAALAATPSGNGYWEVHSDGGVFAFGDARFFGSTANIRLFAPIVGFAPTATGHGYRLVAADGGVFSYGDAHFGGSLGRVMLAAPIVGMAANPAGSGYWLVASDGGVFALGGAPFKGSLGGTPLSKPVMAIAAS